VGQEEQDGQVSGVNELSMLWDFFVFLIGFVFFVVMVRRFNMIVFHTQRTSITTQKLLEEIKETKKEVADIRSLLIPHYIEPTQGENPPEESSGDRSTDI
jgi:hypothetical protein